jgi:hypothetical protein
MKRFTDTEKWRDPWFRRLAPKHKLFWDYICTNCDNAGVWCIDWELAEFLTGVRFCPKETLAAMDNRVVDIGQGRWWVPKFIAFQFGCLSPVSRVHQSVLTLIKKHGIAYPSDTLCLGYPKPLDSLQVQVQVQDKEKDLEKGSGEKPLRLHGIPGSVEEVIAYGKTCLPHPKDEATCRAFWSHYEGQARTNPNGEIFWITSSPNETVVTNWKVKLQTFGQYAHPNTPKNGKAGNRGFDRNAGTLNDPGQYDLGEIKKRRAVHAQERVQGSDPAAQGVA